MAEEEIEQRLRGDVVAEVALGDDVVERGARRVDQPLDVVAAVVGVRADRARLGERPVVDDVRDLPGRLHEHVLEDLGELRPV